MPSTGQVKPRLRGTLLYLSPMTGLYSRTAIMELDREVWRHLRYVYLDEDALRRGCTFLIFLEIVLR